MSGSGKTQLASALLFDAGAVPRLGKVDDGSTVTDYDEEAIARWQALFPDATLERLEDAGHFFQEDRPDRAAAAVRRVLARAAAG